MQKRIKEILAENFVIGFSSHYSQTVFITMVNTINNNVNQIIPRG